MNKDPFTFLQHISGCIENVEEDTHSLTKEQFLKARTINNSVLLKIAQGLKPLTLVRNFQSQKLAY